MNKQDKQTVMYVNPKTLAPLVQGEDELYDPHSKEGFPIIAGIVRFCSVANYSESFGFQWGHFEQTQIDLFSGSDQSEDRFYAETNWLPEDLRHQNILEVGCGAGRFSEVFLRTTQGVLHSVDYSRAVEVNAENNNKYGSRLKLAQASIYELPYPNNAFDRIFCLGVLQHTPSFENSVSALVKKVRPGGEIVVDFYRIKGWYTKIHAKYLLRPFLKRLSRQKLLTLIRLNISWMIIVFDCLCALRLAVFTRFIPIADLRGFPRALSTKQRREWAILDTFDAFSPTYDNPQRIEDVARMFTSNGCNVTFKGMVEYKSGHAAVVRAVKQAGYEDLESPCIDS